MTKIHNLLYYFFIVIISQIISNIWLSFFLDNSIAIQLISILITIILILCIIKQNKKKKIKTIHNKQEKELLEKLKFNLIYCNKKHSLTFLRSVIDNSLSINFRNCTLVDNEDKILHIALFNKEIIDNDDLLQIIQNYNKEYNQIYIYCNKTHTTLLTPITELLSTSYAILTIEDILVKYKDTLNTQLLNFRTPSKPKQKLSLIGLYLRIINPTKWKNYLVWGILLLALSKFNHFKIYYLIFSSLFLILSLVCLNKKLFQPHTSDRL